MKLRTKLSVVALTAALMAAIVPVSAALAQPSTAKRATCSGVPLRIRE